MFNKEKIIDDYDDLAYESRESGVSYQAIITTLTDHYAGEYQNTTVSGLDVPELIYDSIRFHVQTTRNSRRQDLKRMFEALGDKLESPVGSSKLLVKDARFEKQAGATLIQDGGITTPKLSADVLEVKNLKATSGQLDEAVINKLFSDVVVAKTSVANAFIGENAILTGAVTAPKITASEELWAKIAQFVKIRAEHIEADAIDGMVITGPNIRTAASGARVQVDPNGVRVFNADDDVRTHLSPDGSTFKGEVEADTLVVNDGAEFKGNNTLAQGAKLTLAAGVTDPTAPPVVQPFWDGLKFDYPVYGGQETSTDVTGLAFDGTNYWTVKKSGNWGEWSNGVFGNAVCINATTGATTGFAVPFTNSNERFGVTCIGSELFWLYRSGYKAYVLVTDLSCNKKREWEAPPLGYSPTNPLTYKPGIGNDGTNIVIAQCTDAGALGWGFHSKTNGAALAGGLNRGDATKSDITGVYVGNGDLGTKYVVVAKKSTATIQVFGTDGSATGYSWYTESGDVGIVFHDGAFHTLNPAGIVHEYADSNTGDNSGDWWAAYRWYNFMNIGWNHRSRISPPARFAWPRRAKLKIMAPPLPVGTNQIIASVAKNAGNPSRTDFREVTARLRGGQGVAILDAMPVNWQSYPVPTDTNTFPEAESSVLQSSSGLFEVKGDGSGRWGPITFNTNGTIQGATDAGTAIVPINAANTNRTLAVTFTTGRFKTPPTVVATPVTPDPQTVQVSVNDITATGFTMVARRTVASDAFVRWVATEG